MIDCSKPIRLIDSKADRRGVAVLLVLAMIAVTLAASYALMRSQTTEALIQTNSQRRLLARDAAAAGIAVGLRRMHQNDWTGVGTSTSGSVKTNQTYQVAYTTGDPALTSGHPEYGDYPFRVTLTSTGTASDPVSPGVTATYVIRAVVRLAPRRLANEPASWSQILDYIVYQTEDQEFVVEPPARFEGKIRLQGSLDLYEENPDDWGARDEFIDDLNDMKVAGYPDNRPFNGPVHLTTQTDFVTRNYLSGPLGLTVATIPLASTADWSFPGAVTTYKLYPGGATYSVPSLPSTIGNVTYQPNPLTNPLGLFYAASNLTIQSNVTIQGTVVIAGDLELTGSGLSVQPAVLPSLVGSSLPIQLPTIVVGDDVEVRANASGTVQGMVALWDRMEFHTRSQATPFTIQGRLITGRLVMNEFSEWNLTSLAWDLAHTLFSAQKALPTGIRYFPLWLDRVLLLNPMNRVKVGPETSPVTYHWHRPNNPVFVAHPSDAGLCWDLVDWKENP